MLDFELLEGRPCRHVNIVLVAGVRQDLLSKCRPCGDARVREKEQVAGPSHVHLHHGEAVQQAVKRLRRVEVWLLLLKRLRRDRSDGVIGHDAEAKPLPLLKVRGQVLWMLLVLGNLKDYHREEQLPILVRQGCQLLCHLGKDHGLRVEVKRSHVCGDDSEILQHGVFFQGLQGELHDLRGLPLAVHLLDVAGRAWVHDGQEVLIRCRVRAILRPHQYLCGICMVVRVEDRLQRPKVYA
mmetsp:Transcript_52057/g.139405  ORF Transcript_52057/g.139405 Transcript_52057/m.139405 type:complete len:239 (+) Transcript_52057:428-1144(+)